MKIAALQMVSTPDVALNLATARRLIDEASAAGVRLAALPEYFCLMGLKDRDKLDHAEAATPLGERPVRETPIQQAMGEAARAAGLWLVAGTLPLRADSVAGADPNRPPDRVYNACCVFDPEGRLTARYDKIHLFRFDNGREAYDEARVLRAGDEPVAFEAEGLRVGLSVCYDLRFPELYRQLARPACDLLLVPSAFTHTTGQAHWELLLRARAVENQCYVMAPAQGGLHPNGRRTFGHSMVVGPWGEVLGCRPEGEGLVMATIDRERLSQVRQQLPALEHRRLG